MAQFIAQRTMHDILQETEDAIHAGHIDAALAHCQTMLASFPESLEAQRLLGEVFLAQGRLEEALHAFDWVLTNDPENVIAYCNRAIVSVRMSDVDTALDCYQQAYELSRGDGQIRQEFTQLSAKIGQQGFIYSRAGLARLYMRGGLLSQAIQEWQVVLAATPERLDARTGLLETYWREGFRDRVEELANQILRDVPGCLKALLLLAHVTASRDMVQAQTLLRQVEALDPDLMMAQEFAALFAQYPDDPFLKLLKKAPSVINTSSVSNILPQAHSQPSRSQTDALHASETNPQWDPAQDWSINAAFPPSLSDAPLQHNIWAVDHNDTSNSDQRQGIASGVEHSDLAAQLSNDRISRDAWSLQEGYQPEPWEMLQNALQNDPSVGQSAGYQPEPWEMLQNASYALSNGATDQSQSESQQWEDQNGVSDGDGGQQSWESQSGDLFSESNHNWVSPVGSYEVQGSDWPVTTQENNPPSWLSMLTQVDRKETTSATPFEYTPLASIQPEELPASPTPEPVTHQPMTSLPSAVWAQESEPTSSSPDEDDEPGFGPAWLKSLGATVLEENEEVSHSEQAAPSTSSQSPTVEKLEQPIVMNTSQNTFETQLQDQSGAWKIADSEVPSVAQEPWWQSSSESQEQPAAVYEAHFPDVQEQIKAPESESQLNISASWQVDVLEQHLQPSVAEFNPSLQLAAFETENAFMSHSQSEPLLSTSEKMEQDLIATLEELEHQLYAKGFITMEPNSLSAIAQIEDGMTATTLIPLSTQQLAQPIQETSQEQQLLPSALAELGMMFQQPADELQSAIPSPVATPNAVDFPAKPLWLQTLQSATASDETIVGNVFNTPIVSRSVPSVNVSQEVPNTPPRHIEILPEENLESASASFSSFASSRQPEALNGYYARSNPLLDTELEMTTKRPAVRLQSMLHSGVSNDIAHASDKDFIERGEPPPTDKAMEGDMNYQDRLLKGYQHQLVGDYDEAMQDYRLVIRSAPELLGDVISNLRALLKLAPKYSIGYRVLGDAYMRQGEYLQAMESYNSALTMTKKARS